MRLPKITALVREQARFVHYEDGNLWYQICYGTGTREKDVNGDEYEVPAIFEFPVPIADASGARFLRSDKGIFFMRWIRLHLNTLAVAYVQRADHGGGMGGHDDDTT